MRRYLFYFSIAILAFSIGVLIVFNSFINPEIQSAKVKVSEAKKNSEIQSVIDTAQNQISTEKLTCNDLSLQPFWDELNKHESFQDLNKLYLWYDEGKDKSYDCSEFFRVSQTKDLNNDGQDEYFVQGINHGFSDMNGDGDFYVFGLQSGEYKKILFANFGSLEQEVRQTATKGYLDIETRTNDRLGSGRIDVYKFDGRIYQLKNCFTKTLHVFKNGDLKVFKKPLIARNRCF